MQLFLLFALLTGCALAQDEEDLRREIEDIRAQVDTIENRLARNLQVHGFISQGYMRSDDNNWLTDTDSGSFDFREVGVNVSTELTDRLHLGVQLFSRDLGDFSTDGLVLDWAYGDYSAYDWLGLRIGRTKIPLGMYGDTRDVDAVRTQILLPQAVYDEKLRELVLAVNGASLYGNVQLGFAGEADYQFWVGGISVDPDSGVKKFFEQNGRFELREINVDHTVGGYLSWHPVNALRFTGSFSRTHDIYAHEKTGLALSPIPVGTPATANIGRLDVSTIGTELTLGNLVYAAEYYTVRGDIQTTVAGSLIADNSIYMEGYYNSLTYQINERLGAGVYYGLFYENASDKDGSSKAEDWLAWQKDLAFSVRYDITLSWSIKGEIHFINGTDMLFSEDNPDGYHRTWELYLIKLTYSF